MAEITKETVTTSESANPVVNTSVKNEATNSQTIEYLIYFLFGALDIFLVFRLVLKLMGANASSAFVGLVYGITGVFTLPFRGIFPSATNQGIVTTSVLEPATIVAIIVYAFLAWGIVKLVRIFSGEKQQAE